MADFSKLKIDGTTYNVKDETARNILKFKGIAGTPSGTGAFNILNATDSATAKIVSVYSTTTDVILLPFWYNSSWYVRALNRNTMAAYTSNIQVYVYYTN